MADWFDPTIPLKTQAPPPLNPFGMMEQVGQGMSAYTQSQMLQQEFAAKQKAGQILASAPDTDTAIKMLMADPSVAPYAPDTINTLRQAQMFQYQSGGLVQDQTLKGTNSVLSLLPAVAANPQAWDSMMSGVLGTVPLAAKDQVGEYINDLKTSLTSGLAPNPNNDPAIAAGNSSKFTRNMVGALTAAGYKPEQLANLWGATGTQDTGNALNAGVQAPAWAGGGFTSGSSTPKSPPPSYQTITGPQGQPMPMSVSGTVATPLTPAGSIPAAPVSPFTSPSPNSLMPPGAPTPWQQAHGQALIGPTTAQGKAFEQQGAQSGDIGADMIASSKDLPQSLQRIDMMTKALTQFQAGGGANVRQDAGKFVQSLKNAGFDISDDTIQRISNGSLPAGQIFDAEVKPLVISELKEAAQGTGRVMRSEVDAFLAMMDKTADPRALMPLLNQARSVAAIKYDQSQKWPQFKQGVADGSLPGYDPSDFYSWYNKNYGGVRNLPAGNPGGGLNLAPAPTGSARGAGQITHRWDPKTQSIIAVP